jgi:hypothetical protein
MTNKKTTYTTGMELRMRLGSATKAVPNTTTTIMASKDVTGSIPSSGGSSLVSFIWLSLS